MILLEASLRITAIAAMVALVLTVMRIRASDARHAAWTLVLAAMLLMPMLQALTPSFNVRLPGKAVTVLPDTFPLLRVSSYLDATTSMPFKPALISASDSAAHEPAELQRPFLPAQATWTVWTVVRATYAGSALLLLLRFFIGWYWASRLVRGASPLAFECETPVRESALLATPLTVGVLRPIVVVPLGAANWPAEKLGACLAHEFAHIRRRDPLVAFVARLNRCVFWFHPLAWWREHTLHATAEEAADQAGAIAIGDRQRYAAVLVDIAEAVRLRGARVVWYGLGAGGTGLLDRRIDRLLSGGFGEISRIRRIVMFAACAFSIVTVLACRKEASVGPLQPDAEVAAELDRRRAAQDAYETAKNLTAAEVNALESSLTRTTDDFDTLEKLKIFYQWSGQKVFGWNEMIVRRRPHLLWVIENHPEHNLAIWQVSAEADPIGYAQAKERWVAQIAKPDVTEQALLNAAYFFERSDKPLAEQALLRANAMVTAPARQHSLSWELGTFYARVILGPTDPRDGSPLSRIDSDPYARDVRRRLGESDDAILLAAAGERLARTYRDEDRRRLGKQLFERALQLDPQNSIARISLVTIDNHERSRWLNEKLRRRMASLAGGEIAAKMIAQEKLSEGERDQLEDAEPRAVVELSEAERFVLLPELATMAYMRGESLYWNKNQGAGEVLFMRSRKYAEDTLTLAPKFRGDPQYGSAVYQAKVALATHALREGNRAAAVPYMLDAIKAPPSRGLEGYSFGLDRRLVNGLLKAGERETVAEFLERSAELRPAERERLLKEAANIRAGKMPESYQHMVSRQ